MTNTTVTRGTITLTDAQQATLDGLRNEFRATMEEDMGPITDDGLIAMCQDYLLDDQADGGRHKTRLLAVRDLALIFGVQVPELGDLIDLPDDPRPATPAAVPAEEVTVTLTVAEAQLIVSMTEDHGSDDDQVIGTAENLQEKLSAALVVAGHAIPCMCAGLGCDACYGTGFVPTR